MLRESIFSQGHGKVQGISQSSQGILNHKLKPVKSQGIFIFGWQLSFQKRSLLGKGNVIPKSIFQRVDFCGFIGGAKGFVFGDQLKLVCDHAVNGQELFSILMSGIHP